MTRDELVWVPPKPSVATAVRVLVQGAKPEIIAIQFVNPSPLLAGVPLTVTPDTPAAAEAIPVTVIVPLVDSDKSSGDVIIRNAHIDAGRTVNAAELEIVVALQAPLTRRL